MQKRFTVFNHFRCSYHGIQKLINRQQQQRQCFIIISSKHLKHIYAENYKNYNILGNTDFLSRARGICVNEPCSFHVIPMPFSD